MISVLWAHLLSLEAMYQDELGRHLEPDAVAVMGEGFWRYRWWQEACDVASTERAKRN